MKTVFVESLAASAKDNRGKGDLSLPKREHSSWVCVYKGGNTLERSGTGNVSRRSHHYLQIVQIIAIK